MFTQRLNQLLMESGINRAQLSKATDIPLTTMWGWFEKGTQPSADKVVKIADYFEVSTDYLLGRSDEVGMITIQSNVALSEQEMNFVEIMRKLSAAQQLQVVMFASRYL